MRRMVSVILTVAFMLGAFAASAEGTGALDAFTALTGQQAQINDPGKTNAEYLADIMAGGYAAKPADTTAAAAMAPALPYLSGISTRDIAAFASANQYPVRQVRNAYYKALANVFHAEVLRNPASEEQYRNVQVLLSLFLEDDATADSASRGHPQQHERHERRRHRRRIRPARRICGICGDGRKLGRRQLGERR